MQIGTFTKTQDGQFDGQLQTLTLSHGITFTPVTDKESPKSPDYIITVSGTQIEIGAGWNQISKTSGNPYIKVKIDDPSLPNTLWCALTAQDEGGFTLYWSRPKAKPAQGDGEMETL